MFFYTNIGAGSQEAFPLTERSAWQNRSSRARFGTMKTVPLILVLSLGVMGTVGFPQEIEETELPEGVFSKSYELRSTRGGELTFCLRYPPVGKEKVKGVLFFCTPGAPDNYVSGGHLRNFVEAQDLAVVGFGQPGRRWNTTVNTDLLSNREAAEQNRVMNE